MPFVSNSLPSSSKIDLELVSHDLLEGDAQHSTSECHGEEYGAHQLSECGIMCAWGTPHPHITHTHSTDAHCTANHCIGTL